VELETNWMKKVLLLLLGVVLLACASHSFARTREAPAQRELPANFETATFAAGCFWSVEARFGGLPSALHTRCGYTGGTGAAPTYHHHPGDVESVQVDFVPGHYPELLQAFFEHRPCQPENAAHSHPTLFYADEQQHRQAVAAVAERNRKLGYDSLVQVRPFGRFVLAEAEHQKYHLREDARLSAKFQRRFGPDWSDSTAAMRANSSLAGLLKQVSGAQGT
jgi:peptide-methionine (S)-S-oxide reductase